MNNIFTAFLLSSSALLVCKLPIIILNGLILRINILIIIIIITLIATIQQHTTTVRGDPISSVPGIKLRAPAPREEHTLFPDVQAMSGGRAELACNVSLPSADDAVTLVLWYRADTMGVPIYTVDARSSPIDRASAASAAVHTPMASIFGTTTNRAQFDLTVEPAVLRIEPVADDDGMEYRCRVDYRWGRTMSSFITLVVIVPPKSLVIKNEKNQIQTGLIGPYNEGQDIKLVCIAEGGRPIPYVHWYRDNELIDDTYSTSSSSQGTVSNNNNNNTIQIYNELAINRLSRIMFNSVLSCRAGNNISKPISARLTIDVNLKPIDVEILNARHTLISGREVEMSCESRGSRPPAQITWFKDNRELTYSRESISHDGNVTTSLLKLNPQVLDNGAYLSCRAENLRLANSSIEDGWKLNVIFIPIVSLLYKGMSIDESTVSSPLSLSPSSAPVALASAPVVVVVNDGDEIIMECSIKANPLAKVVLFTHDGIQLVTDSQSGIIVNNSSLVITSARPVHKGSYQCLAINSQGKGMSHEVRVNVQYAPICTQPATTNTTVRIISLDDKLKLVCQMDAEPSTGLQFQWTSNLTTRRFLVNQDYIISTGTQTSSTLILDPRAQMSAPEIIQCLATNRVGSVRQPCTYQFRPPRRPEPVTDCHSRNRTTSSLVVDCLAGNDGGLRQSFRLEIYDDMLDGQRLVFNETSDTQPVFTVVDGLLASQTVYSGVVYAVNQLGNSLPFDIKLQTHKLLNKKFVLDSSPQSDVVYDMWTVLIAAIIVIVLLLIIIITIIGCKIRGGRRRAAAGAGGDGGGGGGGGDGQQNSGHKLNKSSDSNQLDDNILTTTSPSYHQMNSYLSQQQQQQQQLKQQQYNQSNGDIVSTNQSLLLNDSQKYTIYLVPNNSGVGVGGGGLVCDQTILDLMANDIVIRNPDLIPQIYGDFDGIDSMTDRTITDCQSSTATATPTMICRSSPLTMMSSTTTTTTTTGSSSIGSAGGVHQSNSSLSNNNNNNNKFGLDLNNLIHNYNANNNNHQTIDTTITTTKGQQIINDNQIHDNITNAIEIHTVQPNVSDGYPLTTAV